MHQNQGVNIFCTSSSPFFIKIKDIVCTKIYGYSILIATLHPMNILRSWREQKIMLKRKFPILSDEDFHFENDDRESMLNKLCDKLNKTKAELELLFAELQRY